MLFVRRVSRENTHEIRIRQSTPGNIYSASKLHSVPMWGRANAAALAPTAAGRDTLSFSEQKTSPRERNSSAAP